MPAVRHAHAAPAGPHGVSERPRVRGKVAGVVAAAKRARRRHHRRRAHLGFGRPGRERHGHKCGQEHGIRGVRAQPRVAPAYPARHRDEQRDASERSALRRRPPKTRARRDVRRFVGRTRGRAQGAVRRGRPRALRGFRAEKRVPRPAAF